MLSLAATATHTATTHSHDMPGTGMLFLIGLAWAVGYLLLCWIWPFTKCSRCHGLGKRRALVGRGFRDCNHCDGSGYRVRPGRHVVNHLRSVHHRGSK
jgi:hypothetical protein